MAWDPETQEDTIKMRKLTKPSSAECTLPMYVNFLLTEPRRATCCQMSEVMGISHESINRFLLREEYEAKELYEIAKSKINSQGGVLSVDDTVIDKPYSEETEIIRYCWSGKHKRVVKGINLVTLVYTDEEGTTVAVNYRIYNQTEGKTKNDYFIEMMLEVIGWGLKPKYVTGDSWYSSQENLKIIRNCGMGFLFGIEVNRLCREQGSEYKQIQRLKIPKTGLLVELKGVGLVKVFSTEFKNGSRYYAQYVPVLESLVNLTLFDFKRIHAQHWQIELFHRTLKQVCNIEKFQVRTTKAIVNHVFCAICSFLKLEFMRVDNIINNWYQIRRTLFNQVIRTFIQTNINTNDFFESQWHSLVKA